MVRGYIFAMESSSHRCALRIHEAGARVLSENRLRCQGGYCEVFVIASQALPVKLRNSCMYNALHLLGCHKSWGTEGRLWNHIFPWLILWEGKHFRKKKKERKKQRRFVFLTLLCADWSHESLDSPAVALALVKPNILPWGGIFKASPALPESSPLPYTLVHLQLTRSFLTLWYYPAKCKVKSSLQNLIYQQWIPFSK